MTDFNQNLDQAKDVLNLEGNDMKKLPQMLNVLTILTYVGCAFGFLGAVYNYFTVSATYKLMDGYKDMTDGLSGTENKAVQSIMSGTLELAKKQYENRMIIMILAVAGVALCFYGALQMRGLKKQGYLIYVVGELIPIISYAAFIGFGSLFGGIGMIFTTLFAALFIILYTTQRKYLVN